MSNFTFKPAKREAVGLLIGLAGASGSGKTFSAMRLASGMAGGKPFAVIDTEAGRAKHYADQFKFDHGDLKPPFRPQAYAEAIAAADAAGYPVIVVDSASHEHAGEGGLLDFHESELDRMAGDDWKKREAVKMAAWIKPKGEHKRFVSKLLQVRAHLILCFRAEEKIEMVRGENGRMQIVKKQTATGLDGWVPISEKNLPYELTASFLLLATHPGVPQPIKLQAQHLALFPTGQEINEAAGKRLAEWASGGTPPIGGAGSSPSTPSAPGAPTMRTQSFNELCKRAYGDDWQAKALKVLDRAEWRRKFERSVAGECLKCGIGPSRETCAYPEACEHPGRVAALERNQAFLQTVVERKAREEAERKLKSAPVNPEGKMAFLANELEHGYWIFDAMHKGINSWKGRPQSERDAFKSVVRGIIGRAQLEAEQRAEAAERQRDAMFSAKVNAEKRAEAAERRVKELEWERDMRSVVKDINEKLKP